MSQDILQAIMTPDFVTLLTDEGSEPLDPELFEEIEEFSHMEIQRILG